MRFGDIRSRAVRVLATMLLPLVASYGTTDDLYPSGADRRPAHEAGSTGPAVGQSAPDFTLLDTEGNDVSLYATLASARAAVLYFVMWCPICDAHMSDMQADAIKEFPDVRFFALDYISGSVAAARQAQAEAGWAMSGFTVLADVGGAVEKYYSAPMGIVVVDRMHVVRMNGEYDGAKLRSMLASLP